MSARLIHTLGLLVALCAAPALAQETPTEAPADATPATAAPAAAEAVAEPAPAVVEAASAAPEAAAATPTPEAVAVPVQTPAAAAPTTAASAPAAVVPVRVQTPAAQAAEAKAAEAKAETKAPDAKASRASASSVALSAGSGLGEGGDGKGGDQPISVIAQAQYRRALALDDDPRNDQSILYNLLAQIGLPIDGLYARVVLGVTQSFVAEEGETGWKWQDSQLAFGYRHRINLGLEDRPLRLNHRLGAWLATSRSSLNDQLYVAPEWRTYLRFNPVHKLDVGLDLVARYYWYRYAEQAGYEGGLNPRFSGGGDAVLEWVAFDHPTFGAISLRAAAGLRWQTTYSSRDDYAAEASDPAPWYESFAWDAGVAYAPLPFLSVGASIEHGEPVLYNGIINPRFLDRDRTELAFSLVATY